MKIFSQCKNKSQGGCTRSAQFMCFSSAAAGKKKKKKEASGSKEMGNQNKTFHVVGSIWAGQTGHL